MTPRSFTCELQSTTVSPIVMLKSLYKSCLYFDVNTMSSVLSSFSFNIFCFIHSLISETHSSIRAISLLCHTYKLYERMILNRIAPAIEQHLIKEQAGFRSGQSCTSQLLNLTQYIEDGYEEGTLLQKQQSACESWQDASHGVSSAEQRGQKVATSIMEWSGPGEHWYP